jgi:hypothetical protein
MRVRWMCFAPAIVSAFIFLPTNGPGLISPSSAAAALEASTLAGKWTYRSFHNNPAMIGSNPKKALDLLFAEATFNFEPLSSTTFKGTIDWPGGGLDLKGTIRPSSGDAVAIIEIVGLGRPNTKTAGWEYDYAGQLAHQWPKGVNQVPAIVGSVIRANPHGDAPAGYVASFIAVRQP